MPGASPPGSASPLPSAIALVLFAYGVTASAASLGSGWLHGLKVVAVAVVAQAVLGMMRSLGAGPRARDPRRRRGASIVTGHSIRMGTDRARSCSAAVAGLLLLTQRAPTSMSRCRIAISRNAGAALLALFFALLIGLPLLAAAFPSQALTLFDAFYRAGSLVFGGGHVVLPLLQAAVVPPGWVSNDAFLAGYGAAQAVPGPLFTFAAYLGAVMGPQPNGWAGAALVPRRDLPAVVPAGHRRAAVLGCAAPAPVRAIGPARRQRRGGRPAAGRALPSGLDRGHPRGRGFRAGARGAFLLLFMWQTPPWLVVLMGAVGGAVIAML